MATRLVDRGQHLAGVVRSPNWTGATTLPIQCHDLVGQARRSVTPHPFDYTALPVEILEVEIPGAALRHPCRCGSKHRSHRFGTPIGVFQLPVAVEFGSADEAGDPVAMVGHTGRGGLCRT